VSLEGPAATAFQRKALVSPARHIAMMQLQAVSSRFTNSLISAARHWSTTTEFGMKLDRPTPFHLLSMLLDKT